MKPVGYRPRPTTGQLVMPDHVAPDPRIEPHRGQLCLSQNHYDTSDKSIRIIPLLLFIFNCLFKSLRPVIALSAEVPSPPEDSC